MNRQFQSEESGFECYGLRSEVVEVRVVPELGARILGLRDRRSGREWLDRPLGSRLFRNGPGDDFTKSTFAGADECIPTVGACRWKNRELPDHGEVWSLPWTVDAEAWKRGALTTSVRLPITPLRFSRTLSLDDDTVVLDYEVENLGTEPEDFLWALHPLIAIQQEDRLVLPAEVESLRVECAVSPAHLPTGDVWAWPGPGAAIHLERLDLGGEGYAKLFAGPLRTGEAAVANPRTGDRIEFRWSPDENPWLGIWLTRGGFRGFHHLAIEPTNGCGDALAAAKNSPFAAPLPPQGIRSWRINLRLSHTLQSS
jgi:galactose mutarotase-like enzyme